MMLRCSYFAPVPGSAGDFRKRVENQIKKEKPLDDGLSRELDHTVVCVCASE